MYDVIIIGGGAAGMTAAMFSARNGKKTLLLDKGAEFSALGVLASSSDMPGIENMSGADVLNKMKKQAVSLGAEIKTAGVTSCVLEGAVKKVTTNEPSTYEASSVILAAGNMPHADSHVYQGEKELRGKGVSHDVETDASLCKNSAVAIVGKSNATAEAALKLAQFAESVYWIIPASKLDINDDLKKQLEAEKKIEPFFSSSLKRINGTTWVTSIAALSAGQDRALNVKYVFLPPQQYKPVTDFLSGTGIQTGPEGEVMVNQQFETSIKGVFACGNILCSRPQLNIVCSAQGAIAALPK